MSINGLIAGTAKLTLVLVIGGFLGERILMTGKPVQFILSCLICGILLAEVDKKFNH